MIQGTTDSKKSFLQEVFSFGISIGNPFLKASKKRTLLGTDRTAGKDRSCRYELQEWRRSKRICSNPPALWQGCCRTVPRLRHLCAKILQDARPDPNSLRDHSLIENPIRSSASLFLVTDLRFQPESSEPQAGRALLTEELAFTFQTSICL